MAALPYYASHKWQSVPHFNLERKWALDIVRDTHHTCLVHNKKYYDIDTGKINSDKITTIYSQSISELTLDCYDGLNAHTISTRRYKNEEKAWFVPQDDNFDEECRLDEERKRQEELVKQRQLAEQKLAEQIEQRRKEIEEKERAYQLFLQEREIALKERQQKLARMASMPSNTNGTYIITYSGRRRCF